MFHDFDQGCSLIFLRECFTFGFARATFAIEQFPTGECQSPALTLRAARAVFFVTTLSTGECQGTALKPVTWRIFTTLLSRFGERISTMKSHLLAARRRALTSASRVTRIIVLFANFFFFSCERKLCCEHLRGVILQRF